VVNIAGNGLIGIETQSHYQPGFRYTMPMKTQQEGRENFFKNLS